MTATTAATDGSKATDVRWRPERLDDLMRAHGFSNAELANLVGSDRVSIYRYRTGRRTPSAPMAAAIAAAFPVALERLVGAGQ